MAINLSKGQTFNLSKSAYDLSAVTIGLGWDVAEPKQGLIGSLFGSKAEAEEYDLDAVAFLCASDGKVKNFGDDRLVGGDVVFFNNLRHPSEQIWLTGDNRTGAGDGDDEQIIARLNTMPAQYSLIAFVVQIYQGIQKNQHFGNVRNAFIRAVDARGVEMARVNLSASPETQGMHSLIFADLVRQPEGWLFRAIAQPYQFDSFVEILKRHYV